MRRYDDIPSVVQSLAGSTSATDYPWLPGFVDQQLTAAAGRAEAITQRTRAHSEAIREAIRGAAQEREAIHKASGPLPMDQPEHILVAVVDRRLRAHPGAYGLEHAPCLKTIRDEIRGMQESGNARTAFPSTDR